MRRTSAVNWGTWFSCLNLRLFTPKLSASDTQGPLAGMEDGAKLPHLLLFPLLPKHQHLLWLFLRVDIPYKLIIIT